MKNLVVLLLLLLPCISGARPPAQDSIRCYYDLKNKAELSIIDSQYQQALHYYKAAFRYKVPEARDAYNAFVLAYRQTDSITAKACFNLLAAHGQTREKLEEMYFGRQTERTPFYQWVAAGYDSIRRKALASGMPGVAAIMDSIYKADQDIRMQVKGRGPTLEDAQRFAVADARNVAFLKKYSAQHGFPGYEQVGNFEVIRQGYINAPGTFWLVMWHTRHVPPGLGETALKAVLAGQFPPDEYALIMDSQAGARVYYQLFYKAINATGEVAFDPVPDEVAVNRKRAAIYLEPLADLRRKLYYQQKAGYPFLIVAAWVQALNFSPVALE